MGRKTVFVTSNFVPVTGGIAHFLFQIVRYFPPECVAVVALPTPGFEHTDAALDFTVKRLRVPSSWKASSKQYKLLWPVYLLSLLSLREVDAFVCDNAHHTLILPALIASRLRNARLVVFAHGTDVMRPQKKWWGKLLNMLLRSADVVVVNSHSTRDVVRELGVTEGNIKIVHPPLDQESYHTDPVVEDLHSRYGLSGKKVILTVARLVERKGIDTVLKALPAVISRLPNVHYIIVGDGGYKEELVKISRNTNVDDHVTFTGYLADKEVQELLSICDVFVMVSRKLGEGQDAEGFGIVYLEANLFGKPVIAGDSGGVRDAVVDGLTGLLIKDDSVEDLAASIAKLLLNPDYSLMLGSAGRVRVLTEFNAKKTSEEFQKMLSSL